MFTSPHVTVTVYLLLPFPQDSCYVNDTDTDSESKVDEAIRLCVTVIDFAPESKRAAQMLVRTLFYVVVNPKYVSVNDATSSYPFQLSEPCGDLGYISYVIQLYGFS